MMKPDALPLAVVIWTTPAWMLSMRSARDDLLSSERSAAPMNWMLRMGRSVDVGVFLTEGAGVLAAGCVSALVAGGFGVLVTGGIDVLVAGGAGVIVAGGNGVLVAGGAGTLVLGEGRDSVDLGGSSAHPATVPISMNDQIIRRTARPFIGTPSRQQDLGHFAKSCPRAVV